MIEPAQLRLLLSNFLGEERFESFLVKGFSGGGLRFWQEQDWKRFTLAHPQLSLTLADLDAAMRFCHVHKQELKPDTITVSRGCHDFAPEYFELQRGLFPHAADFFSSEGLDFDGDTIDVWYCEECRKVKETRIK